MDQSWEKLIADKLCSGISDPEAVWMGEIRAGALMGTVRSLLRVWSSTGGQGDLGSMSQQAVSIWRP